MGCGICRSFRDGPCKRCSRPLIVAISSVGEAELTNPITGMDGRGTISGWSWGRHIWFQKVMPYLQVMHDPKPIALDDYVQAHFGEHLAGDPDKHSISYRGVVAPNRQTVKGTWRIPHRRLSLASGRVIVVPLARGTWEMRRQ